MVPGPPRRCCPLLLLLLLLTTLGRPAAKQPSHLEAAESLQGIPPSDGTSTSTRLDLKDSQITLSEEDRLALNTYPQLEELILDGGQVTRIPPKHFEGLDKLRVLSLSRNHISSLDAESFSGLGALTRLDLSHNQLTSIDSQLFKRLRKIQELHLQGNPWNCSCPLLSVSEEGNEASAPTGGGAGPASCVPLDSPAVLRFLEVTHDCNRSSTPDGTPGSPETTRAAVSAPPSSSRTATVTSQSTPAADKPPGGGNSWKFTVCVAALAAGTFTLILCAIKGPSWYKLFHNYRHRRLREEEEEEEEEGGVRRREVGGEMEEGREAVSTVLADTRRPTDQQLFTFEFHNEEMEDWEEEEEGEGVGEEGGEDGYFEDPYFRRED